MVDSFTFLWYNSLSDRVIHFPVVNYIFRGGTIMNRIQFYPSQALADILNAEAAANGVSVSKFVVDKPSHICSLR